MTDLRELVAGLVTQHSDIYYNADHGTFSSRGRAAITAETLRKILQQALGDKYDSRMVAVEGKHAGVYIHIPRLQHQWWPGSGIKGSDMHQDVKTELNFVVQELRKALEL